MAVAIATERLRPNAQRSPVMTTPGCALFAAGEWRAVEQGAGDVPALQRFFEANPGYFVAVGGQPAAPGEAHEAIFGALPAGWPYTKKWSIGFIDEAGALVGMANVVSDLLAPRVWHIGLFIIAAGLHGRGVAQALYRALERWACDRGAQWLRLGVVEGNARAERFWERCAYREVRRRGGFEVGNLVRTIRVMMKPLANGTLADYLALVPRDTPESC
jgi:GNAT superfamily N-acetyltransferase